MHLLNERVNVKLPGRNRRRLLWLSLSLVRQMKQLNTSRLLTYSILPARRYQTKPQKNTDPGNWKDVISINTCGCWGCISWWLLSHVIAYCCSKQVLEHQWQPADHAVRVYQYHLLCKAQAQTCGLCRVIKSRNDLHLLDKKLGADSRQGAGREEDERAWNQILATPGVNCTQKYSGFSSRCHAQHSEGVCDLNVLQDFLDKLCKQWHLVVCSAVCMAGNES